MSFIFILLFSDARRFSLRTLFHDAPRFAISIIRQPRGFCAPPQMLF